MKGMKTTKGHALAKLSQLGEYKEGDVHATITKGRPTRFMAANGALKNTQRQNERAEFSNVTEIKSFGRHDTIIDSHKLSTLPRNGNQTLPWKRMIPRLTHTHTCATG
eukprot:scaffold17184_cov27-Prasinocladus_malaysianus.AAC.2